MQTSLLWSILTSCSLVAKLVTVDSWSALRSSPLLIIFLVTTSETILILVLLSSQLLLLLFVATCTNFIEEFWSRGSFCVFRTTACSLITSAFERIILISLIRHSESSTLMVILAELLGEFGVNGIFQIISLSLRH